jgi:YHS domain-containing protein
MAHQTNVNQVKMDFPARKDDETRVKDPFCGTELKRRDARHVLFQAAETLYFCSRRCRDRYRSERHKTRAA